MQVIQQGEGYYYMCLWHQPSCLKTVIDLSLEHIWIVNHFPVNQVNRWWECDTQIKENGLNRKISVREMKFDIYISTDEFLDLYEDFINTGIRLYQLNRPVPLSLLYFQLPEKKRQSILKDNGVQLGIEFPLQGDIGNIWSVDKGYLEKLLDHEEIRKLAFEMECEERKSNY